MSGWIHLKQKARLWYRDLLFKSGGDPSAPALLAAATEITGIKRIPLPAEDNLLMGAEATFDRLANVIFFNSDVGDEMAAFYQMHEFAHYQLHDGNWSCESDDIDPEASEDEIPLGIARVESYNPREQAEREANIYAREVLLPSTVLHRWFVEEGVKASEIAQKVQVSLRIVEYQISFSVLVSSLIKEPVELGSAVPAPPLDGSQKTVAEWEEGPLMVEAGPGTGKTKTLVGRIEFLLFRNVTASSILALTFSNKAAEEMRSRITFAFPAVGHQIWIGTFHAFGLELLRKYGFKMGVKSDFAVIDPIDAIFMLEENLHSLDLVHYRNLYDPSLYLPHILSAISRAKDELVSPADYMSLAENMIASAGPDEKKRVAGEKAREVAKVYGVYHHHLETQSLLDFGDLIYRSVTLLRENADVREEVRQQFSHVLVDEYQDVNRASGMLLRELSPAGAGLWVVGDTRQSIYRFRGAAPENMGRFEQDFPGSKTKPLEVNYRSLPKLVDTFATLAPQMGASGGRPFTPWRPYRTSAPGVVKMRVADTLDSEAAGIAKEIIDRHSAGCSFRDQAILCRSHTMMERIASRLEQANVPILYLGDLFERDEIRNLISLLSLTYKSDGSGLLRVSFFPEYQIPLPDVLAVITYAKENAVPVLKVIGKAAEVPGISPEGCRGLALLASHLDGVGFTTTPWHVLVQYLFDRSEYLAPLLIDDSVRAQQKRLAIYQFIEFSHDRQAFTFSKGRDPKKIFVDYIRRLEIHGEERQLRQVPDWATGFDAVRVLSVHGSKGLEFNSVFLPYLAKGHFPASNRVKFCPPPDGMLDLKVAEGMHTEEEECLFFVALSRARDFLCLSRSAKYGLRGSSPSNLLQLITHAIPASSTGQQSWPSVVVSVSPSTLRSVPSGNEAFDVRHLDAYMKCPRKYYYQHVLGLIGRNEGSPYLNFHRCVYRVVRWIGEERAAGAVVDDAGAFAKLTEIWSVSGPSDHSYERFYWEQAIAMVSLAVSRIARAGRMLPPPNWEIPLEAGRIQFSPDFIEEAADHSQTILRFRTGRPKKEDTDADICAIYQTAVKSVTNGKGKIALYYLSTGDTMGVDMSGLMVRNRLTKYNDAITGIRLRAFPTKTNDHDCPRCPFYFLCPSGE